MKHAIGLLVVIAALAGCATTEESTPLEQLQFSPQEPVLDFSDSTMSRFEEVDRQRQMYTDLGVPLPSEEAIEAMAAANTAPLGSFENPVRTAMPGGQRAYLQRLRCSNGQAPRFERTGNVGAGVYGTIIDRYEVDCGSGAPGRVEVYMDMYHRHVETIAVPGFTIVPYGVNPMNPI